MPNTAWPDLREDRARLVLDALPHHRHGIDDYIWNPGDDPADDMVCAVGAMAVTASRHGAPIVIRRRLLGPMLHAPQHRWFSEALLEWLGITRLCVDAARLPSRLWSRINAVVGGDRFVGVWPVTGLSDAGVAFDDLADALRVMWGVDAHLVAGTPEHAWFVAQQAAEADPWDAPYPCGAVAVSA